jgi:hypothetical protein
LQLTWAGGSPASNAGKTISANGNYTGLINANGGVIFAVPVAGGPYSSTVLQPTAGKVAGTGTWAGQNNITVATGGVAYSVIAWCGDGQTNENYWCAPYASVQVQPAAGPCGVEPVAEADSDAAMP